MSSNNHVTVPDGGWGWVVVLSSFTLQALTIGITYTFGVIFVPLMNAFQSTEAITSWIGSIQPCLLYLTGIVAGPLIKRFGWRAVTIGGSLLSAAGFLASSFANSIYLLYFTYGVLTGIGNGLMYVTSMVAVQHYFDRRRAMATGLAVSGSGVGTLVFGIVTQKLLDSFDWRWTLRVQTLIILLGAVAGAMFRPLPSAASSDDDDEKEESYKLTDSQRQRAYGAVSEEKDPSGGGVIVREPENPGCCCFRSACLGGCTTVCRETFDFSLFKNPIFCLYCTSIILFCFGYHVPYTYTPDRAVKQLGIDSASAAFLVSIMGISNVVSRLFFGWVGDRSPKIRFYLGGVVLTLGGVVSCMISLFRTHPLLILYSILFGAFTGCWASLFPVILVDLLGIEVIEKSLGQCLAAGSFAFLFASPMSGLIIEKTNSYEAPYQVVGAAETVGGLIFFCIQCFKKHMITYQPLDGEYPTIRKRYMSESFS